MKPALLLTECLVELTDVVAFVCVCGEDCHLTVGCVSFAWFLKLDILFSTLRVKCFYKQPFFY